MSIAFMQAVRSRDVSALAELLAEDAVMLADGGGTVSAVPRPLHGGAVIARTFVGFAQMPASRGWRLVKKYLDFSMAFKLDEGLVLVVNIRASQLNGWALCLDMHVKQARLRGERELRLHHLAIWRESQLFTPRERAALGWTEALMHIPPQGVCDAAYAQAREQFSQAELSDLSRRVAAINGGNRLTVAFRTEPGSKDRMLGLDKAGLN